MRLKKYLIESSGLKNYIKSMLLLFDKQENSVNDKQLDYWKWQGKQAKSVKCKSYKDDPGLEALVDDFMSFSDPRIKECYRNSWMMAMSNPREIEVVGGYTAAIGVPIAHAWNFYKPKKIHFDLTAEICLNKKPQAEEYLQIIKIKGAEATKIMSSNQFSISGLVGTYYFKKFG
jgi:hypothetical protein